MIIIGYPGIGKTTVSKNHPKDFFDLDSSNMVVTLDGSNKKPSYWYEQYVNIALGLNEHPITVFVSSHKEVQDEFKRRYHYEDVYLCYPSLNLKDDWINRVSDRYMQTHSAKDKRALDNVIAHFDENVLSMKNDTFFKHIELVTYPYDLYSILKDKSSYSNARKMIKAYEYI